MIKKMKMLNNLAYFLMVIIVLNAFFGRPGTAKYQVARYNKDKAIVIDTQTGESWCTKECSICEKAKRTYLLPIRYIGFQKEDKDYTPNPGRNNNNTNWYEYLKRLCFWTKESKDYAFLVKHSDNFDD